MHMKNQYIADIGDYGKYSMLKHFEDAGIRIAINWYLTKDDNSNDGKHVRYLLDDKMRVYDSTVFDVLKSLYVEDKRTVSEIEKSILFQNVRFYNKAIDFDGTSLEIKSQRKIWHYNGLEILKDTDLVFLDPDNGLLTSNRNNHLDKYVLPNEVFDYYKAGRNVVFYCHKGRRNQEQWEEYKRYMHNMISYSKSFGITFHKGTQRSYIFVVHPKDYERYLSIISFVLKDWDGLFTFEAVDTRSRLKLISNEIQKFISLEKPRFGELFKFLESNGMVVHNYSDFASSAPIDVDFELENLDSCDVEKCCALVVMMYREDHFCNGSLLERWQNGEMQKVLRRLMQLINN